MRVQIRVIVTLALVLGACGGSDEDGEGGTTTMSTSGMSGPTAGTGTSDASAGGTSGEDCPMDRCEVDSDCVNGICQAQIVDGSSCPVKICTDPCLFDPAGCVPDTESDGSTEAGTGSSTGTGTGSSTGTDG